MTYEFRVNHPGTHPIFIFLHNSFINPNKNHTSTLKSVEYLLYLQFKILKFSNSKRQKSYEIIRIPKRSTSGSGKI
jgi:hypothetical protein